MDRMHDYRYYKWSQIVARRRYPAGESHVELRPEILDPADRRPIVIEARCRNFEDLCELLVVQRIADRHRLALRWFVPYFPFARHDRRNHGLDGCEVELALDLLRGLDMTIVDPHSDVTARIRHIPQSEVLRLLDQEFRLFGPDSFAVVPDLGAQKKAKSWCQGRPVIQAQKTRDPLTGKLSGFSIEETKLHGRPCVIVDDICDGGGTFLGVAQVLKAKNAGPLTLVVSHGLFTKGSPILFAQFDRIVCAGECDEPKVECLSYQTLYEQGQTQ